MTANLSTLILTIDGLGTRDLGAYGNTWIETPAFDRLAARSLLFEHAVADDWDLCKAMARMASSPLDDDSPDNKSSMLEAIRQSGIETVLFTDDPDAFPPDVAQSGFSRRVEVPRSTAHSSAHAWDQTHCATYFAQLVEFRQTLAQPYLLWAHYAGLTHRWDAPYAWRERFVEEGDPQPPSDVEPPSDAQSRIDPDQQLSSYQCLAAEILVLDACLGPLIEEWQESSELLVLSSPRGYPLGEHGILGYASPILYSEQTSVPLLIGIPSEPIGWRFQELTQPRVVGRLLRRLAAGESSPQELESWTTGSTPMVRAIIRSPKGAALRTEQWLLVTGGDRSELYAKPDDRWEFNDVSSRCPQVVEQLTADLGLTASADEREQASS